MEQFAVFKDRTEIPVNDTWALEHLYASDELWEKELETIEDDKKQLVSFAGRLSETGESLYNYLHLTEQLDVKVSNLANYCMRKSDVDTRNSKFQSMVGRLMSILTTLGAETSFDTPEIMEISDDKLDEFYALFPALERYRRYLTNLRRRKAHVLSPAEEKILAAAGEMSQTPDNVYGMLSNADLTFPDAIDCCGQHHKLTQGTFVAYEESSDRELRRSAYENLYSTLASFKNTLAGLLNGQNKKLKFYAETRKYPSAFEASLDSNDVPTSVYLNLIETVHKNIDKMHRYINIRKKALAVDQLHFYDIYTPLVNEVDKIIPLQDAKNTVLAALKPLGEEYCCIIDEGFRNRWIDAYQNEGKRSGAYSAGARVHPYVLLNYTGTLDSQFTLAHEMGHALHSYLSNRKQNPVDADYVIFVAEVASTVNEALLMEYLLNNTQDKKERAYLINHFLNQFKGTIYRQTMFAEFELNIGKMVENGTTLTEEILCDEYRRLNEFYYGEGIVVDDSIAMEWARIPHFYYNYYVFQYATGYAAAIALSKQILNGEKNAVNNYISFLSAGCTKSPIELLKGAGVDMTTPQPIEQALDLFGNLLDEMESLLEV